MGEKKNSRNRSLLPDSLDPPLLFVLFFFPLLSTKTLITNVNTIIPRMEQQSTLTIPKT